MFQEALLLGEPSYLLCGTGTPYREFSLFRLEVVECDDVSDIGSLPFPQLFVALGELAGDALLFARQYALFRVGMLSAPLHFARNHLRILQY